MNRHTSLACVAATAALILVSCSDPGTSDSSDAATGENDRAASGAAASSSDSPTEASERVSLPVTPGTDIDGLVRVGGHDLAVHCAGEGSPTAVILHGWIDEPGVTSEDFYGPLSAELEPDFRVCSYDRANVGDSETVPGTHTPESVVADLDGLMAAIGEPGPYVLIGQSAGGMVASAYAVAHPDKVAGMVMVDATFDEEVTIEDVGMVPKGAGPCDPENRRIDGMESLQKIDNCAMYKWAYERRDRRPEVPLVYLAAKQAPWSDYSEFGPRFTKAIVPLQRSYAESWSPGRFVWVDSGHDIHSEKPRAVGDAVRWVVEEGRA
jgi:pimeloyl-ACP methyl ester carboxylesterase